ncbi:MFS transporter [Paenibacillus albiflavus]|uniref:MFS transporter n=1 Tax=Paenibacillus albiflavus TaxID=2545760 RepID=A0A4R4EEV2_9BACL|nr:MDR family MFS transporter [Paenibacillus albiflavus]TCZ76598.1 MFS transporter [Paenibacillus albiflavus]
MRENNKTLVLIGLLIGLIFSGLDETIVSTAMPTIIRELHGLQLFGWVAGIYMLTMTAFMPIFGKLADLFGHRRIFMICMSLFIAGSIVNGFANSMELLLIGRGIQGVGAGGLMPLAMVIMGDTYPLEQRAKIQSMIGPLLFLPQLIGPTVGGFIVSHWNWHWIFLINIPIGLLSAIITVKGLRENRREGKPSIDWAGSLTLVAAIVSLLLTPVLKDTMGYSWSSPLIVGLMILGVILIGLFIWIESRVQEPIIPLHLFRNRNIVALSTLVFIVGVGVMGVMYGFPFYAQHVIGLTPAGAGYLSMAFMLGAVPMSMLNGFTLTKLRYRNVFIVSFVLPIIAFFLLSQIGLETSIFTYVIYFIILGAGLGVLFAGDNLIVQESVDSRNSGIALSTVQLFQALGTTIGLNWFGSMMASQIASGVNDLNELPAGVAEQVQTSGIPHDLSPDFITSIKSIFVDAFHNMYFIALVMSVAAFIVCWFLKNEILAHKIDKEKSKVMTIQQ